MDAAERAAWDAERPYLRLEVRRDDLASQRLFERLGYRRFDVLSDPGAVTTGRSSATTLGNG